MRGLALLDPHARKTPRRLVLSSRGLAPESSVSASSCDERRVATNLLHDTLLRANREPILKLVLGEISLGRRLFVLNLANRLFDVFLCRRHV